MFTIPAFLIGAIVGWFRARKFGGKLADKIQYAAIHGIFFFLVALIATVLADWQGWV
ncbi:hypothetical protein [Roseobacter sp. N2S]|uniref:hypothetical protein n=1 Tax=Roseobacter sp. N2S TaxID=2663844 RepID=UPI0028656F4D|nr:hypothetical protein [Roseobacter sp. N2S]MDR6264435.1 nitrate/nitrite transporter NarK [Roseobacter sp. N2S]